MSLQIPSEEKFHSQHQNDHSITKSREDIPNPIIIPDDNNHTYRRIPPPKVLVEDLSPRPSQSPHSSQCQTPCTATPISVDLTPEDLIQLSIKGH